VRVLGIDPGTAITGYALVGEDPGGEPQLLCCGTVQTQASAPMPQRLLIIYQAITELIQESSPDAVAVEELFFKRNVTTALTVGQARGVVLLAAAQARLPVHEYKPADVKMALVGYGGADKRQMQEMVRLTLRLDEIPRPDDAADAAAVAICHLRHARLQQLLSAETATHPSPANSTTIKADGLS
jgi:crossover junction endodeoxyribonuclease RuvC